MTSISRVCCNTKPASAVLFQNGKLYFIIHKWNALGREHSWWWERARRLLDRGMLPHTAAALVKNTCPLPCPRQRQGTFAPSTLCWFKTGILVLFFYESEVSFLTRRNVCLYDVAVITAFYTRCVQCTYCPCTPGTAVDVSARKLGFFRGFQLPIKSILGWNSLCQLLGNDWNFFHEILCWASLNVVTESRRGHSVKFVSRTP